MTNITTPMNASTHTLSLSRDYPYGRSGSKLYAGYILSTPQYIKDVTIPARNISNE